jgi:hypothetical protein
MMVTYLMYVMGRYSSESGAVPDEFYGRIRERVD